jgi:hypothetical protein
VSAIPMRQRCIVRLYKDGDHMGIATDARSPMEFWWAFSEVLARVLSEHFRGDEEFQLSGWLPIAAEIAAKLGKPSWFDVTEHSGWMRCGEVAEPRQQVYE